MQIRGVLVLLAIAGGGVAAACSREAAGPDDGPRTTLAGTGDSAHTGGPPSGTNPPPPPGPDTLKPLPPTPGIVRVYGRVNGGTFIQSSPPGADTVRMEWLANVAIRVESGQGGAVVAETTTGSAGNYVFEQLPSGTYTIRAIPPAGSGYAAGTRTVTATIGDVQVDFTLWRNR